MGVKINLTRLLARMVFIKLETPTTDASYLPLSKDRTSQEDAYAFELVEVE